MILSGLVATGWPFGLRSQPRSRPRIGFLGAISASGYADQVEGFRSGLREAGYEEGRNVVVEYRWAEGKYERLRDLATELVSLDVDVILTHGTPATLALKQATTTIPIVMATSGDADHAGLVASLAHPGGNVTGMSYSTRSLASKRIELLQEVLPAMKTVGFAGNPSNITPGWRMRPLPTSSSRTWSSRKSRARARPSDEGGRSMRTMSSYSALGPYRMGQHAWPHARRRDCRRFGNGHS